MHLERKGKGLAKVISVICHREKGAGANPAKATLIPTSTPMPTPPHFKTQKGGGKAKEGKEEKQFNGMLSTRLLDKKEALLPLMFGIGQLVRWKSAR